MLTQHKKAAKNQERAEIPVPPPAPYVMAPAPSATTPAPRASTFTMVPVDYTRHHHKKAKTEAPQTSTFTIAPVDYLVPENMKAERDAPQASTFTMVPVDYTRHAHKTLYAVPFTPSVATPAPKGTTFTMGPVDHTRHAHKTPYAVAITPSVAPQPSSEDRRPCAQRVHEVETVVEAYMRENRFLRKDLREATKRVRALEDERRLRKHESIENVHDVESVVDYYMDETERLRQELEEAKKGAQAAQEAEDQKSRRAEEPVAEQPEFGFDGEAKLPKTNAGDKIAADLPGYKPLKPFYPQNGLKEVGLKENDEDDGLNLDKRQATWCFERNCERRHLIQEAYAYGSNGAFPGPGGP